MKKKIIFPLLLLLSITTLTKKTERPKNTENKIQDFDETVFNWSRTFAQVMDIANKKHYKIDDPQESMIRAIDGFVNNLDPHSSFLDPKTYQDMLESTSGEFYGIGIVIDNTRKPKDKTLTIVDTIPDGPSDTVGIQPLDKIIEIDGKTIDGMTTEQIIRKLKGERQTKVTVKIMREGHPDLLTFEIIRDVVKEQHSLSFHIKSHNIYYLSLTMFTDAAVSQIEQLLAKSDEHKYKGLILDLRNNSGGLLNAAIDIAGLFLEKDSLVVVTKDKNNEETESYKTTRAPIAKKTLPIFILINNFTASAGEILAGCLKIHSDKTNNLLVFLVGTKTFGKGSVQEVIPISNDCALKITTSLYFLPDDNTVQGIGIEPDFTVERMLPQTEQLKWFTKNFGRESSLENHIRVTKNDDQAKPEEATEEKDEKKKSNRWQERAKEMLQTDNQLRDTITLINIINMAQTHTPQLVKTRADAVAYLKQNHIGSDALEIEEIKT